MKLCKRVIIFSLVMMASCLTRIKKSEPNESLLVEAVVQILESCYGNRITAVGLAGNSTGLISEALWRQGSYPITLIDGPPRKTKISPVYQQIRHRLQVFVITASSSTNLTTTLKEIKTSIWWNHMATFLVLDWQLKNQECKNAFEMLWAAWKMNLLNAKFLCYHWTKGRLIYTFNPYTNWAPKPWSLEKNYSNKTDHPWTLFVRRYEENNKKICEKLDFEKANNLGGYQIRVSSTYFGHELVNSNRACPGVIEDVICQFLFPALNATPKVLVHVSMKSIGFVDKNGNASGILGEVINGSSDIALLGRSLSIFTNLPMIYPHYQTDLRSLTQYSGYKSQLEKIRSVIDSKSRFGLYIVCLITVLFFKYVVGESVPVANLSTFRIICNSSLPKISDQLGTRIYLGSLFFFAVTMQGIYQGQLASLLTKQEPLRNVNTMTDLAELGHMIYEPPTYGLYFGDPAFEGRYFSIKSGSCTKYVLRSPDAACIGIAEGLIYDAVKYKLHMSREALVQLHLVFPIRPDWPLEQRVNTIVGRAVEANIMHYVIGNINFRTNQLLEFQEVHYKDQHVKILNLKQLGFAFAILGIGLGFATVSFIVEAARG